MFVTMVYSCTPLTLIYLSGILILKIEELQNYVNLAKILFSVISNVLYE